MGKKKRQKASPVGNGVDEKETIRGGERATTVHSKAGIHVTVETFVFQPL